jgi:hypothetical protein
MRACPFIMFPRRPRDEIPDDFVPTKRIQTSDHNPGVWLLWITSTFAIKPLGDSAVVVPGPPSRFEWRKQGKPATPTEVNEALRMSAARQFEVNPKGRTIDQMVALAEKSFPASKEGVCNAAT